MSEPVTYLLDNGFGLRLQYDNLHSQDHALAHIRVDDASNEMTVMMRFKMAHRLVVDCKAVVSKYDAVVAALNDRPFTVNKQMRTKVAVFSLFREVVASMEPKKRFYFEPPLCAFIVFLANSVVYGQSGRLRAKSDYDATKFLLYDGPSGVGESLESRASAQAARLGGDDAAFVAAHEAVIRPLWRAHFGNTGLFSMDTACAQIALQVGSEVPDEDDASDASDELDSVDKDEDGDGEDGNDDDDDDDDDDNADNEGDEEDEDEEDGHHAFFEYVEPDSPHSVEPESKEAPPTPATALAAKLGQASV